MGSAVHIHIEGFCFRDGLGYMGLDIVHSDLEFESDCFRCMLLVLQYCMNVEHFSPLP